MKKYLALVLALCLCVCLFAGCGGDKAGSDDDQGSVYYLNFKPEQDAQWQELAKLYTDKTGVPVTVVTAASGNYETTLAAEIAKTDAPTLFQVNGPVGLENWIDYCYDLSGSDVYGQLTSDDFALKGENGEVYGISYVIETYGIIVNTNLLEKAGYKLEDINSFESLKKVAEDITARSSELGFSAFTSAGMDGSSDWRFKTHLANMPLYFEYQADGIGTTDAIKGTFLDNYRDIWDLYINNGTCDPKELSAKTGDDAVAEFTGEQAVFYQNGTWAYGDVASLGDDNLAMIPIYIGAGDEANQGLCTGTENYWCVNGNASEADIQATLDFLNWCVTDEVAVKAMCGGEGAMPSGEAGMGFVIPFKNALESDNLFVRQATEMINAGKTSVSWNFPTMPSEQWKNDVGSALTAYAADQTDANWDAVVKAFVDGWAAEYALKG